MGEGMDIFMTLFMNSPYHWPSLIDQSSLTGFRQAGMIIRIPVQTRLKINFQISDHKKFFKNWFAYLIISWILRWHSLSIMDSFVRCYFVFFVNNIQINLLYTNPPETLWIGALYLILNKYHCYKNGSNLVIQNGLPICLYNFFVL